MIRFVSGEYPPDLGGVGDYTWSLQSALAALGCKSSVINRHDVGRWDARSLVWLIRHMPRSGVVHIQFQAAAYELLGDVCLMPALLRRFRPGVRSLTTFHDVRVPYLFPRAGQLRQAAVQFLARTSHAVVAADERDLRALGGPSVRHRHIPIGPNIPCAPPTGYDRDTWRARLGLQKDDLAVVYFGLLNASKGLGLLLDAVDRVLAEVPKARLLLLGGRAGASDLTDRDTAARLQPELARLADRVIQTGWLAPDQLSAYLLAGDVALLPYLDGASARRGSLLACAEHGLPIVSTLPAGSEVAPFIEAVDPNAAALGRSVLEVFADPTARRASSRVLASQVSWPRIAADHLDLYKPLLYSTP